MHIEQADLGDAETIRACHVAHLAAQHADQPDGPWMSERPFSGWLKVGWGGDPREAWLVRGLADGAAGATQNGAGGAASGGAASGDAASGGAASGGAASGGAASGGAGSGGAASECSAEGDAGPTGVVAGWYRLELPDRENLDRANLHLIVRPAERRGGLGRALLRHAAARAAANGRSVLFADTWNGSPGDVFARSVGAEPGLVNVQRVLELGKLGETRLAELREPAERAAASYSLTSWTGLVPDQLVEQTAALYAALNDAPHDPGNVPETWDAQRVRERINGLRPCYGLDIYSVAARHDATGEMAALTELAVDPADPCWGHQMITAVAREHRGHRLGLLVKVALLELLLASEPRLERVATWNAQSNMHMIAINDALGYTILGQPTTWWRLDVASVLD